MGPAQASVEVQLSRVRPDQERCLQQPVMADVNAPSDGHLRELAGVSPLRSTTGLAGWLVRLGHGALWFCYPAGSTGFVVVALIAALFVLVPRNLQIGRRRADRRARASRWLASLFSSTNPSAWGITGPAVPWG